MKSPRCLIFDIETAPITAYVWGLYDQNIGLNQIKADWTILAWSAKWLGSPKKEVLYMDNRNKKNVHDDKELIFGLWKLLNEADVVISQNGDKFDIKKFNARAAIQGLSPVRPFKSTDTLKESRKVFGFTSHSLEYMSGALNKKYKKLKHKEYPGFELWKAVLSGNKRAWAEMKTYCVHDVLATEELYTNIQGWIKTQDVSSYIDDAVIRCKCGSTDLRKQGYAHTDLGKYQQYQCKACGKWPRSSVNILSKERKQTILRDRK